MVSRLAEHNAGRPADDLMRYVHIAECAQPDDARWILRKQLKQHLVSRTDRTETYAMHVGVMCKMVDAAVLTPNGLMRARTTGSQAGQPMPLGCVNPAARSSK